MFPKYQKNLVEILTFLSKIMQICSKTQEFTQNSREIGQKTQFSGKSATLCLPEDRPLKRPELVEVFVFVFSTNQTKLK